MFKKLKVRIKKEEPKKEEPKYEPPKKSIYEYTLSEIAEVCKHYANNHEKCPLCCHDEFGVCCYVRGELSWDCKLNPA